MSGSILSYSPGSKTFVPRGSDGKYSPRGPVQMGQQGVVQNKPQAPPGPTVLTQKPAGNRP